MRLIINKLALCFILTSVFCGCNSGSDSSTSSYSYSIPEQVIDGWQTASLDDVGISQDKIEELINKTLHGNYPHIDGIVIVKNNQLIFEHYFNGYNRSTPHELQSVVKSIDSTLIGLAIQQGYLLDVEQPIYDYLTEYHHLDWSNGKSQITIKDLLTMRSGLACQEGGQGTCNSHSLNQQNNWTEYTLKQSLDSSPGEVFSYFTGLNIVSHTILENVSNMSVDSFTAQFLLSPLEIGSFSWGHSPSGEALSGNMLPRDMAKFGQLILDNGQWQGQQVISADWVSEATGIQVAKPQADGVAYGYWWWLAETNDGRYPYISARGANDQFIIIFPTIEMVVVLTGNKDTAIGFQLVEEYIIGALE